MSVVFITPSRESRVEYKVVNGIYLKCKENDYDVEFRGSNSFVDFLSCIYFIFMCMDILPKCISMCCMCT